MGVQIPDVELIGVNHIFGYVEQNPVNNVDPFGEFKGNPFKDLPKLVQCIWKVSQIDTKELNKQCKDECGKGQWGGSMQSCAWNKTKQYYKKCVELATPGK